MRANNGESHAASYSRQLRSIVPILVLLGVLTGVWILLREYRSTVTMELHFGQHEPLGSNEWFIAEQEAILRQSEEILRPVIEQFELTKALSPNGNPLPFLETKDRLARSIEVRGIPDTDLMEVSVYHRDAQLASGIANAIAECSGAYHVQRRKDRIDRAWAQLESEINQQKIRVEKARQEMAELKDRGGIVDPDPNQSVSIKTGADQTAIINYSAAKAHFLSQSKILEAGERKFRADKEVQPNWEFETVKVRERADPARHRAHVNPHRIWEHHKFLCGLGLITGLALIGLTIVTGVNQLVKPRPADTMSYDY